MKLDVNRWIPAVVLGGVLLSAGCASWDGYAGVDNRWRAEDVPAWEPGKTKAAEVVNFLGPPSQLIPLHDETVFYYMREGKDGKALLLLVWNQGSQVAEYDRAIFFFDEKGVLKNFAYSNEALPYESMMIDG
jgi:outer membrane protein assembly factor BamE (lipoprotein component of BamABCDE complex)